jgi:cell pole-organizing protein PopZ
MNKPATKEPSMDEILSSIRQIIADDDAAATTPPPPVAPRIPPSAEPLALSPSQMLPKAEPAPAPASRMTSAYDEPDDSAEMHMPTGAPQLLDPEDIAFEGEPEPPPPIPRAAPPPKPAMSVAQAAPMPDPALSRDMAEELLAPATNAAVASTFGKLTAMATIGTGQTVEGMMREMLKPMLKEWLDENLPSVVERMVEKEIARISRGK